MNTVIPDRQRGNVSHHPKLKEQLKRYNISFREIKEANAVIIQIKARTEKPDNGKEAFLFD